jgi:hypothetical protein
MAAAKLREFLEARFSQPVLTIGAVSTAPFQLVANISDDLPVCSRRCRYSLLRLRRARLCRKKIHESFKVVRSCCRLVQPNLKTGLRSREKLFFVCSVGFGLSLRNATRLDPGMTTARRSSGCALMSSGVRVHSPSMRRQGHSPDILWTIKFNSAVQQILGIDIDNASLGVLVGQIYVNRDSRTATQRDRSRNQCSMKTHQDSLAVTRKILCAVFFHRNCHLKRDTSTSSGLTKRHAQKNNGAHRK